MILFHLVPAKLIQCCLEVVKYNRIGETFKDKREFPEWVDVSNMEYRRDGEKINDDEDDTERHTQ
jgi:hypothetical protein